MKLKIGKEFEVDVDRIRNLSMRGNTITIETHGARYEISDTSQEVSNGDKVEDPSDKVEDPSDKVYNSLRKLLDLGLKYIFMASPDKNIIATVNKPTRKDGSWLYDATDKDLQITNEAIPTIDSHATLIDIDQWIKWNDELR